MLPLGSVRLKDSALAPFSVCTLFPCHAGPVALHEPARVSPAELVLGRAALRLAHDVDYHVVAVVVHGVSAVVGGTPQLQTEQQWAEAQEGLGQGGGHMGERLGGGHASGCGGELWKAKGRPRTPHKRCVCVRSNARSFPLRVGQTRNRLK